MSKFALIPAALACLGMACLTLAGCEPSNGQMTAFSNPQAQHVRQFEADLAAEQEKNAQLTKRCEQLSEEIAKLRWREQQLELQLQAIGDAPRQRDYFQRHVLTLTAQVEALRGQVIALGGTPPPPEPLPPLPPPRVGSTVTSLPTTSPPPAYAPTTAPAAPASRPATAPAGKPQPVSRPAGTQRTALPAPPEDVTPATQESR